MGLDHSLRKNVRAYEKKRPKLDNGEDLPTKPPNPRGSNYAPASFLDCFFSDSSWGDSDSDEEVEYITTKQNANQRNVESDADREEILRNRKEARQILEGKRLNFPRIAECPSYVYRGFWHNGARHRMLKELTAASMKTAQVLLAALPRASPADALATEIQQDREDMMGCAGDEAVPEHVFGGNVLQMLRRDRERIMGYRVDESDQPEPDSAWGLLRSIIMSALSASDLGHFVQCGPEKSAHMLITMIQTIGGRVRHVRNLDECSLEDFWEVMTQIEQARFKDIIWVGDKDDKLPVKLGGGCPPIVLKWGEILSQKRRGVRRRRAWHGLG